MHGWAWLVPALMPCSVKVCAVAQVKATMKITSSAARVLQRILNARQFGLKMIANVSYGYTSASFSGRMPFSELADSIVQVRPSLLCSGWGCMVPPDVRAHRHVQSLDGQALA